MCIRDRYQGGALDADDMVSIGAIGLIKAVNTFRPEAGKLTTYACLLYTSGLDPRKYVFCGGGFPIRLKTGELVAVALVSGLPDVGDHGLIVDCLSKYLGVEAPSIPL